MKHTIDDQIVSDAEIQKLYQLNLYSRWIFVLLSWLFILPWAIWQFRETISLCQDYCTWATIRLGMEFNFLATVGISFCIGFTTSVLIWQSMHIIEGDLSQRQKYYLAQKIRKIRQQGQNHCLYRWIYPSD